MQNAAVKQFFKEAAPFWRNVYDQADVYAIVHQQRRDAVLATVEDLRLAPGTEILDVGCGAGTISVPLSARGFKVKAVDGVPEMLALTNRLASDSGVEANLETSLGDIHRLDFPDNAFQLVLAIGVLPWLTDHQVAVRELARVVKPGGYVLVNIDNSWGLHRILDPLTNFLLAPLRAAVGRILRFLRLRKREPGIPTSLMSMAEFDSLLRSSSFEPLRRRLLGFGPFTMFHREILPIPMGIKLHNWLQKLCDAGFPVLHRLGGQYLVLARKTR